MATLRLRRDGSWYLVNGYAIHGDKGSEDDAFFRNTNTLATADSFFNEAGYREGEQVERTVFYALLIGGDLTNDAIEGRRPITADVLPRDLAYTIAGVDEHKGTDRDIFKIPEIRSLRGLLAFWRYLSRSPIDAVKARRKLAAVLCLMQQCRQRDHDTEVLLEERDQLRKEIGQLSAEFQRLRIDAESWAWPGAPDELKRIATRSFSSVRAELKQQGYHGKELRILVEAKMREQQQLAQTILSATPPTATAEPKIRP